MQIEYDKSGRMSYHPEFHFNQNKRWDIDEVEYLINWYDIIGAKEMSLALGRTEGSVEAKVFNLRKTGHMKNILRSA